MSGSAGRPRVVVVGLGPAGPDLTTQGAAAALAAGGPAYVRTHRHPAAQPFVHLPSFDHLYESAESFAALYPAIVEQLVAAATEAGSVTYAVPGSPHVLERTVELLAGDPRVEVHVEPAMSFLDLTWARLGVDPVEARVTLVDGHRFATAAAGVTGAVLIGHTHDRSVLSDVKLAFDEDEPQRAVIVQRLGLPDERITEVAWADLDRSVEPDHLTSVFVPDVGPGVGGDLVALAELVGRLRRECPWDREQTHRSLARYALEETHEVLDAIGRLDVDGQEGYAELEEELGDLLFQVFLHSAIATEAGQFTVGDVARGIHDKLYTRHPHVFAPDDANDVGGDPDRVVARWEDLKKAEKGRASVFDGIPTTLPALALAQKVLTKAERINSPVLADLDRVGAGELPSDDAALGRQLLGLVAAAHRAGLDAELALRDATTRLLARARSHETSSDG